MRPSNGVSPDRSGSDDSPPEPHLPSGERPPRPAASRVTVQFSQRAQTWLRETFCPSTETFRLERFPLFSKEIHFKACLAGSLCRYEDCLFRRMAPVFEHVCTPQYPNGRVLELSGQEVVCRSSTAPRCSAVAWRIQSWKALDAGFKTGFTGGQADAVPSSLLRRTR
jgi:hypothetical protein